MSIAPRKRRVTHISPRFSGASFSASDVNLETRVMESNGAPDFDAMAEEFNEENARQLALDQLERRKEIKSYISWWSSLANAPPIGQPSLPVQFANENELDDYSEFEERLRMPNRSHKGKQKSEGTTPGRLFSKGRIEYSREARDFYGELQRSLTVGVLSDERRRHAAVSRVKIYLSNLSERKPQVLLERGLVEKVALLVAERSHAFIIRPNLYDTFETFVHGILDYIPGAKHALNVLQPSQSQPVHVNGASAEGRNGHNNGHPENFVRYNFRPSPVSPPHNGNHKPEDQLLPNARPNQIGIRYDPVLGMR